MKIRYDEEPQLGVCDIPPILFLFSICLSFSLPGMNVPMYTYGHIPLEVDCFSVDVTIPV